MIRERIVLEHGPGDKCILSAALHVDTIIFIPVWNIEGDYEEHHYHRTPRNSGAPEFRRIYIWVEDATQ